MKLGQQIKDNRERLGMSQEDLAKAIFVSRQTISNWETHRTYPDVQSLLLLSRVFETSVDSLVREDAAELQEASKAESRKMNRLSAVMAVFGLTCVAWVLATALLDLDIAVIVVPAVVLYVPAMAAAIAVEKMKHDNQLFTYQALEAFLSGKDPDVLNAYNQRAGRHWMRKTVLQTLAALVIGACCGWGAFSIVSTLLGG